MKSEHVCMATFLSFYLSGKFSIDIGYWQPGRTTGLWEMFYWKRFFSQNSKISLSSICSPCWRLSGRSVNICFPLEAHFKPGTHNKMKNMASRQFSYTYLGFLIQVQTTHFHRIRDIKKLHQRKSYCVEALCCIGAVCFWKGLQYRSYRAEDKSKMVN